MLPAATIKARSTLHSSPIFKHQQSDQYLQASTISMAVCSENITFVFNAQSTPKIICRMCNQEKIAINPEVARQVEQLLVGEFNVSVDHVNRGDFCDGCYRLLMLTNRVSLKLRRRNEAAQRAKDARTKAEVSKPPAVKRPASPKEVQMPAAKRIRQEEPAKVDAPKEVQQSTAKRIREEEPVRVERIEEQGPTNEAKPVEQKTVGGSKPAKQQRLTEEQRRIIMKQRKERLQQLNSRKPKVEHRDVQQKKPVTLLPTIASVNQEKRRISRVSN